MDRVEADFYTIFHIITGNVAAEYPFHWVENAFVPGTQFSEAYQDFWNAREHLCERFGIDFDDDDLELFMDGLMKLEEDLGRRMFLYGIQYAGMEREE